MSPLIEARRMNIQSELNDDQRRRLEEIKGDVASKITRVDEVTNALTAHEVAADTDDSGYIKDPDEIERLAQERGSLVREVLRILGTALSGSPGFAEYKITILG